MVGPALLSIACMTQSPKLRTGETYSCQIERVVTATQFSVSLKDGPRGRVLVSLPSLGDPPRDSWAFGAGEEYLSVGFGPNRDKRYLLPLKVRIRSIQKPGQVVADLFYVAHHDSGEFPDPNPSDFPIADDLVRFGLARVTEHNSALAKLQVEAQKQARGMWTRKLPPVSKGDSFGGGVLQVLSPTRLVVGRPVNLCYNTTPPLKVRVEGLVEPPQGTAAYAAALNYSKRIRGELKRDIWSGRVEFQGYSTSFAVSAVDRDGTAACSISYMTFSPDTPDGMFRSEDHDFAAEMLLEGLARIDPKAEVRPIRVRCEAIAKAAQKGIWARQSKGKRSGAAAPERLLGRPYLPL
jgi:endonuclease YncB( thermonuclease family)